MNTRNGHFFIFFLIIFENNDNFCSIEKFPSQNSRQNKSTIISLKFRIILPCQSFSFNIMKLNYLQYKHKSTI